MASTIRTKRWSRVEYERLTQLGAFRPDERLELLAGELVVREPQGGPHALTIELCNEAMRAAFGRGWRVRVQLPVALDHESEPEPDLSVFRGDPRETGDRIPAGPALIIEIAESSLSFDRGEKASLYARAGIPDYWIVNLGDRVLEVYRQPAADADTPFGWRYGTSESLATGAFISPLAAPHARVAVGDLLP